jgi:enoyl-CoA hydratase
VSDLTSFDVRYDDGVAHLRLNRPEQKNAITLPFFDELKGLVEEIDREARARVIVLSSTGRHFCVGLDLTVFGTGAFRRTADGELGRRRASFYQTIRKLQDAFTVIEQSRIPVIAAVQGACAGAALALVSACDLRYATQDAFFLVAETNLGFPAEIGTLQRLPKLMPEGVVREIAYRGTRLPATRAEQVGFVNETFAGHDALLAGVSEIARDIAAKNPLGTWGTKHLLNHARDHAVDDGLDLVALWQAGMYFPDDTLATLQARKEGRAVSYENLRPAP